MRIATGQNHFSHPTFLFLFDFLVNAVIGLAKNRTSPIKIDIKSLTKFGGIMTSYKRGQISLSLFFFFLPPSSSWLLVLSVWPPYKRAHVHRRSAERSSCRVLVPLLATNFRALSLSLSLYMRIQAIHTKSTRHTNALLSAASILCWEQKRGKKKKFTSSPPQNYSWRRVKFVL